MWYITPDFDNFFIRNREVTDLVYIYIYIYIYSSILFLSVKKGRFSSKSLHYQLWDIGKHK